MRKSKATQKKNTRKIKFAWPQSMRRRFTLALLGITICLSALAFLWFRRANYRRIVRQNQNYIESCTAQEAKQFQQTLQNARILLTKTAGQYAALQAVQPDANTAKLLLAVHDDGAFDQIAYISPEGLLTGRTGTYDVSGQEYFRLAMQGYTGWDVPALPDTEQTDGAQSADGKSSGGRDYAMVYYTPIRTDGRITGVMAGFYNLETLQELFSGMLFRHLPYTCLLREDGSVALCLASAEGEDILSLGLADPDIKDSSDYEKITAFLEDPSQTMISFSFGGLRNTAVGTLVRLPESGWMFLNVLSDTITASMVSSANRTGMLLEILLITLFLIYFALIAVTFYNQERHLKEAVAQATGELNKTLQKERETQAALNDAYNAAQMASSAKTTFLSQMSHDMRTPLNAIIGMTAIAGTHLDDRNRVAECLSKITSSSRHLLSLINDVLDMSKIESGKVDLSEEEFSLPDLIDNMLTLNRPLIEEKGHTLTINIHDVTHENVIGDSVRLQQVFTNLLSNAAKYTPNGGNIRIELTEKTPERASIGSYEIVFQDNGIGMSEDFQKELFQPFVRADDDRVFKTQGTGLGMPIARNIIHMMNGEIQVESRLNEGTTITVTFCLKLHSHLDLSDDRFLRLPVLVADDDQDICESTCRMLDELGMNSEWVLSGEEAVEKTVLRHEQHDDYYAVILDWKMPGIGGVGAARAIRQEVSETIPIIIISAYDWSDIEEEALDAGVTTFITKPLFKSRVVHVFNELFLQTQARQSWEEPEPESNLDISIPAEAELLSARFSGKRILLVEDNDINLEIAEEILGMAGLTVDTATNGQEAVEQFSASTPGYYDLVFMDIQMPIMNGYEATETIRSLDRPDAKRIPIVAMSANAFSSDVHAALKSGMNGHIAKPIDFKYLAKILNKFLVENETVSEKNM